MKKYQVEIDNTFDLQLCVLVEDFKELGINTTVEELIVKFAQVGNLQELLERNKLLLNENT